MGYTQWNGDNPKEVQGWKKPTFIGFQQIDSEEKYNSGPKRTQEQYTVIFSFNRLTIKILQKKKRSPPQPTKQTIFLWGLNTYISS